MGSGCMTSGLICFRVYRECMTYELQRLRVYRHRELEVAVCTAPDIWEKHVMMRPRLGGLWCRGTSFKKGSSSLSRGLIKAQHSQVTQAERLSKVFRCQQGLKRLLWTAAPCYKEDW